MHAIITNVLERVKCHCCALMIDMYKVLKMNVAALWFFSVVLLTFQQAFRNLKVAHKK